MNKYFSVMLFFFILISGCVRHNQINFSSSEAFFSSLNEKNKIQKEKKINKKNKIQKEKKINKKNNPNKKKLLILTLSSYEKQLKRKFGFNAISILKTFNKPSLEIKHGKIKNYQYHLKSCHLDLFFLNEDETYIFRHFDIRPSTIKSSLNKKECFKQLNNNFTLIRDQD